MIPTATPRYARPEILEKLSTPGHHVIEASAGTGKTFTIEHLVVDRVLQGVDLTQILVVTFTERAAAELRARIRALLWKLLVAARSPALVVPDPAWTLDEKAANLLLTALSRIDAATISTIHAFCQRLLTENAFAHGRLFSQRLADGQEVFSSVFRDFMRTELKSDPDFGCLLRDHLSGGGLEEDDALRQLEETLYAVVRFHGQLEPQLDQDRLAAALATLPGVLPSGAQVVAAYKGRNGKDKIARVMDAVQQALETARGQEGARRLVTLGQVLAKDGKERVVDYALEVLQTAPLSATPQLVEVLTLLASELPEAKALIAHLYRDKLKARIRERKEEQGLFDYDDMLEVVAGSLAGEAAQGIKDSLRERYAYVLIDEFQDTDPVQWQVFQALFAEPGSPTSLSVIGDPKQAIYGFRAADVETYLGAREALLGETDRVALEARIERLKKNFRSSARMVDGYNFLLQQVSTDAATIFQADDRITYGAASQVSCGDPSVRLVDPAGNELTPIHLLQVDLTDKGKGKTETVEPVARFIAAEVERLLAPDGPRLQDQRSPQGRPLRANDLYVLARSRADAQSVATELGLRGLPFSFYKLDGLFETEEVSDLVEVLAAVVDPFDRRLRVRAWLTPFFGLSPLEAERALEAPDDHPLVQRLRDWNEHARRRDHRHLFSALIQDSGLAGRAALMPDGERALTNVQRVLDLLAEEARRRHATLDELVELLRSWRAGRSQPGAQDADTQPLETEKPAVQLMTMHAAKGLEAAVVFLIGGTGQAPPRGLRVFHREGARRGWLGTPPAQVTTRVELEARGEDERLHYVALTRARVRMYLPCFVATDAKTGKAGAAPFRGGYRVLNDRLWHALDDSVGMVEALDSARADRMTASSVLPERSRGASLTSLFTVVPLTAEVSEGQGGGLSALATWTPPVSFAAGPDLEPVRRLLARNRRGALVTSYTQLAARAAKHAPLEVDKQETTGETNYVETHADELVTSNVVGNFLHDALEELDLPLVHGFASGEAFAQDQQVRALVEPLADAAGIARAQRPHAYRLLYASLRSPIDLGPAGVVPCIAGLPKVMRESEFLFPIPERGHRLLGAAAADPQAPFAVGRGLVKGFIDVVFEYDGRFYFGDWKSSVLPDASPAALKQYVDAHFHWQVVVYGVAVLRLLGVTDEAAFEKRFGGFLYFFLRDMERTPAGQPTRGTWFDRPDWNTVRAWERELLEHDFGRREGS